MVALFTIILIIFLLALVSMLRPVSCLRVGSTLLAAVRPENILETGKGQLQQRANLTALFYVVGICSSTALVFNTRLTVTLPSSHCGITSCITLGHPLRQSESALTPLPIII